MIGYEYNPATLPSGATSWQTSTGQMKPVYDGNSSQGQVGHNASYMRVVEAYQVKKQIDQEAFNSLALYNAANKGDGKQLPDPTLTPALDFYNEYVWSARGGTQEIKHTYTTTYEDAYTTSSSWSWDEKFNVGASLALAGVKVLGLTFGGDFTQGGSNKRTLTYSGQVSFDIAASFDGIENDTQMRYASNNDAHFVMNFNSMFNPANQSGLNLAIGSDGLVYNIAPSVSSGAGLPMSDNIDTTFAYMQPQPSYTTGNADGLAGTLEAYDRPGKTKLFRTYAFYRQPKPANGDDLWNTVIDQNWLDNSPDTDAVALREAKQNNNSIPWRMFYRVTYSERFLAPISTAAIAVPQITPVYAVPVTNAASDFLFQPAGSAAVSPLNLHNDTAANIVLIIPTASGLAIGSTPKTGTSAGVMVQANNVIPFDLAKNPTTVLSWGDAANSKLLSALTLSVSRQNIAVMTPLAPQGSVKVTDVTNAAGTVIYNFWQDPNGLTINVAQAAGITVYLDINGNPVQYFDGKSYQALQAGYVPTRDGSITYYIQPPSTYDQSVFSLLGDDDLFGAPGDQWRYYLVSAHSSDMTANEAVKSAGPFLVSGDFTGFTIAKANHDPTSGAKAVQGYVLVRGMMQWPSLNTAAESFADVQIYKSLSLLDTFPIGDPFTLIDFLKAQYPGAPFVGQPNLPENTEIELAFAKNITSYFNSVQQALTPQ
jgi:hypothetical protein